MKRTNGKSLAGNHNPRQILFLEPVLKECVWGGDRLVREFHYMEEGNGIGECWAVSAHPHGDCVVREGEYKGKTLSRLYEEHRELFGNLKSEEFPLLVKVIDAKTDLSLQVHPDDEYARQHESRPFGKTECWYIMDCPENASLVIGHHAKSREELKEMIEQNRYEELIRQVPVRKGDFVQIVPGTVHAIKEGFLILETQQNSDITYRVYDYGRLVDGSPRQLHVKQSMEVINVPDGGAESTIFHADSLPVNQMNLLAECSYYKVWKLPVKGEVNISQEYPFLIADILEGGGAVDGRQVKKGDHFLLPAGYGSVSFCGEMDVILSAAVE